MPMICMGIMVQILLVVLVYVLLVADGRRWKGCEEVRGVVKWDDKRLTKSACKGFGVGACFGAWGYATVLDWSLEVRSSLYSHSFSHLLASKLHLFSIVLCSFFSPGTQVVHIHICICSLFNIFCPSLCSCVLQAFLCISAVGSCVAVLHSVCYDDGGDPSFCSPNRKQSNQQEPTIFICISYIIAVMYCICLFGNSFIIREHDVHVFLGGSALLACAANSALLCIKKQEIFIGEKIISVLDLYPIIFMPSVFFYVAAAAFLRVSSALTIPSVSASIESTFSVLESLAPLPIIWWLCGSGLSSRGNVQGRRSSSSHLNLDGWLNHRLHLPPVTAHSTCQGIALVCVGIYWLSEIGAAPSQLRMLAPRIVYIVSILGLFWELFLFSLGIIIVMI